MLSFSNRDKDIIVLQENHSWINPWRHTVLLMRNKWMTILYSKTLTDMSVYSATCLCKIMCSENHFGFMKSLTLILCGVIFKGSEFWKQISLWAFLTLKTVPKRFLLVLLEGQLALEGHSGACKSCCQIRLWHHPHWVPLSASLCDQNQPVRPPHCSPGPSVCESHY